MSGGSYDYRYYTVDEYYVGKMYDSELNEMMKDLIQVLHDVEWWQSSDIDEEDYRKTVDDFKKKWFRRRKTEIQSFINSEFEMKKEELVKTLKYLED